MKKDLFLTDIMVIDIQVVWDLKNVAVSKPNWTNPNRFIFQSILRKFVATISINSYDIIFVIIVHCLCSRFLYVNFHSRREAITTIYNFCIFISRVVLLNQIIRILLKIVLFCRFCVTKVFKQEV